MAPSPPKALWIAERNGVVMGSIYIVPSDGRPGTAQLRMLYVEPEARGLGIGRLLVEQAVRFSRDSGYSRVRLWTQSILVPARKLYAAAGFRRVDSAPHHSFRRRSHRRKLGTRTVALCQAVGGPQYPRATSTTFGSGAPASCVADHLAEIGDPGGLARGGGDVRGEIAVVERPERALLRQRLDFEHVEARGRQRAIGESAHDVGVLLVPAAGRVDQHRPVRQSVTAQLLERLA